MSTKMISTGIPFAKLPESYIRPISDRPNSSEVSECENVPVIDLGCDDRELIVRQIGEACQEYGFFQVINHGVGKDVVEKMQGVGREFFSLPAEEKMKLYSDDPSKTMRLSTSFNVKKETIHNWRDYLRLHCYPLEKYSPEWPSNLPSFRETVSNYCKEVRELGMRLEEAISESLGLEKDYIKKVLGEQGQHMAKVVFKGFGFSGPTPTKKPSKAKVVFKGAPAAPTPSTKQASIKDALGKRTRDGEPKSRKGALDGGKKNELSRVFSPATNVVGHDFGQLAEIYVEPRDFSTWKRRTSEEVQEACRRASAELFFHSCYNPSDTKKLKASLDAAEAENAQLKKVVEEREKEVAALLKEKNEAAPIMARLKAELPTLKKEVNSLSAALTAESVKSYALETKLATVEEGFEDEARLKFAEGFKSYAVGFLAVDPDYDWVKFGEETVKWMRDFQISDAAAIAERKAVIEKGKEPTAAQGTSSNIDEARPVDKIPAVLDDSQPPSHDLAPADDVVVDPPS